MPTSRNDTYRLTNRVGRVTNRRPSPPQDFRAESPGWFTWTAPADSVFTHFRLRIDRDHGEAHYELPAGQRSIQLFIGNQFALTTYNDAVDLESYPVYITYNAAGDMASGGGVVSEEQQVTAEHTLTASTTAIPCIPSPSSGLRLVVFINQDATGGREITWASCFKNAPVDIDGTASTQSVVGFVYKGGYWYFDGSFSTGLSTV